MKKYLTFLFFPNLVISHSLDNVTHIHMEGVFLLLITLIFFVELLRRKRQPCCKAMNEIVTIINEVGFPIAATLGLGFFLWKLLNKIVNGMEQKIDVVDDKINESLQAVEKRLDSKLDSQTQILIQLIDRVRSVDNEIIRQDILLKTILGVPNLIEKDKIAKANQKDKRKD